jgi:thimet oligopeptidase
MVNHVRETDEQATGIEVARAIESGSGLVGEPWPPELHDHRATTAKDVAAIADAAIAEADATVAAAIASSAGDNATFADVIGRIEQALGDLTDADGRSGFMVRVHPDAAVRAAGQAANERITTWRRSLPMRDDLADAIERYAASPDARALEGEERRLLDLWQRDLRRAGHGLPPGARAELRDLTARAVTLEAAFQRNVDEWEDGIDVSREDLVGLPDDFVGCLPPGALPGTLRVSLQNPDYMPFMEISPRRDLREALRRKRVNRAVAVNRPILEEILALRRRHAAILGYPSWADYRIEPKMARTPERVAAFHASIFPALRQLAARDYAAMRARLEAETGSTDLQLWDAAYYDRRIRADEYDVDQDEVSAYLTLDAVIDGLLRLTQDVFGLRYREVADPRAWAPEVRLFEVQDAASGARLGWFYLDLHPRPGKFQHAMAQPLALPRRGRDGVRRGGISAIVCNIPASTAGTQARLRHDDVEMLFHEFGHVLHEVLGTNAYWGTSMERLEDDFPEAVSQIMENWAWEPEILARVSRHVETGAPMPTALAERLRASRNVNLGSRFIDTFAIYGDFDLRLHGPEPVDLDEAMAAAESLRELPPIDDSFWPAAFAHLVGGYDAGYYGYLWSLVYGDDLWSRFVAEGIASPVVGAAYRREILEPGASRDAESLVEAFLGRPSTNEAFLRRTGIGAVGQAPPTG